MLHCEPLNLSLHLACDHYLIHMLMDSSRMDLKLGLVAYHIRLDATLNSYTIIKRSFLFHCVMQLLSVHLLGLICITMVVWLELLHVLT